MSSLKFSNAGQGALSAGCDGCGERASAEGARLTQWTALAQWLGEQDKEARGRGGDAELEWLRRHLA